MARKHLERRRADQRTAGSRRAERRDKHEAMLERHDEHCGPLVVNGRKTARVAHYRETVPAKTYPYQV